MSKLGPYLGLFLSLSVPLYSQDGIAEKIIHKTSIVFKADLKWGSGGSEEGMFLNPKSLYVDSSDNVYVLDNGNNRVQKFDSEGKFIATIDNFEQPDNNYFAFKPSDAKSIAVDKEGNFFFLTLIQAFGYTADKKLIFVHSTGGYITAGYGISHNGYLYGLASADEGGGNMTKRTRGGKLAVQYPDNVSNPTGVGVDSEGNLYALCGPSTVPAEFGVQKYGPNGDPLITWGKFGAKEGQFMALSGIAVDDEDHLYILDSTLNRVQAYTPDGKLWNKWGSTGIALGQMRGPNAIAVNSKGQVYILDAGNNRVQRFTRTQVDVTLNAKGKILKRLETPLIEVLAKAIIAYDEKSNEPEVKNDGAPQPMNKKAGDAVGDAAKKIIGL